MTMHGETPNQRAAGNDGLPLRFKFEHLCPAVPEHNRRRHTCMTLPLKATVYIAATLDGFIARENGGIDWLPSESGAVSSEDYGYETFMRSVDVLVIGRHTFEKVLTFGDWPYSNKRVVVLSTQPLTIPPRISDSVECMSGSPTEIVARLAARGHRQLYVDGGLTVQRFLEAGAIQRLIITRIPVLIGQGISLFGPLRQDIRLRHVETRQYSTGLVQSEYEVVADLCR